VARILALTASPEGAERLRLDAEVREIKARLLDTQAVSFRLIHHGAVRAGDLPMLLQKTGADIVHFGGHAGTEGILLEDLWGNAQLVAPKVLASVLGRLSQRPRIVVLNACYSNELASPLVEVVEAVVGMSDSVGDNQAIAFAAGFYGGLSFGRNLVDAFEDGRSQIPLANLPGELVPQLLCRAGVTPDSIRFDARPEIMARVCLDADGAPQRNETNQNEVTMMVWLRGAPEDTISVSYQIAYPDLKDSMWEVRREETPDFETEISLYGDVEVRAVTWSHDGGYAVRSRLSTALRRSHGKPAKPRALETALLQIEAR